MFKYLSTLLTATLALFGLSLLQQYFPSDLLYGVALLALAWGVYIVSIGVASKKALASNASFADFKGEDDQIPKGLRLDWLLLLRFLAAACVLIYHSGSVFHRDRTYGGEWWGFIAYSPAWWGMVLFFTLSGFLMGKSFTTGHYELSFDGVRSFLKNRVVRIFPLMITVALIICIWQVPTFITQFEMWIRVVSLTFNGFGGPEGLGAFWSLSTEFQFYAFVPVIFLLLGLRRKPLTPGTVMFIALVFIAIGYLSRQITWDIYGYSGWSPFIYEPFVQNLDAFGLGLVAAIVRGRWPSFGKKSLVWLWPFLVLTSYLVYSGMVAYPTRFFKVPGLEHTFAVVMPLFNAVLIALTLLGADLYSHRKVFKKSVGFTSVNWLFKWAGALTYPIYLIHSSILLTVETAYSDWPEEPKLLLSIILIILVSVILNLTVEKGAERWKSRR